METEHRASIEWSAEHVRCGLLLASQTIDPAWFVDDEPGADGWSLVCQFPHPPAVQGNPSEAAVRFLAAWAPHARLRPGAELRMYERATGGYARVIVLD